jgi:hypothetical protein
MHVLVLVARGWFQCRACDAQGTLRDAIAHAVANQFRVS